MCGPAHRLSRWVPWTLTLDLLLIPGPDDPPLTSDIGRQAIREFQTAVTVAGFNVSALTILQESADSETVLLGQFFIKLAPSIGTTVAALVGGWLHAKYGRKVRLKIGDIEAEAHSLEAVEKLLARAQKIQQRNEPKKIHEP